MTKQKGTCEISHHTLGTVEFLLVGKECTLMLEVGDDSHVREWSLEECTWDREVGGRCKERKRRLKDTVKTLVTVSE